MLDEMHIVTQIRHEFSRTICHIIWLISRPLFY